MNDQFPPEAEGCEGMITKGIFGGKDPSFKLVEDFRVTQSELEVLACNYLELMWDNTCFLEAYKTVSSYYLREFRFASRRLDSIERILGKDVLDKVLAPIEEKGRREFEDMKVDLATPVKCEECGEEFGREVLYQVTCVGCPPVDGSVCLEGVPF